MKRFIFLLHLLAAFCIANAQNVGIGTTAPTERLHVAGNIKADTLKPSAFKLIPGAGDGKVLTSDASGNASWQANSVSTGYGVWGDCATNSVIGEYQPVVYSTGQVYNYSGNSVSISGNYAIVGARYNDVGANTAQGSASIYQYIGNAWVLMQKITDPTGAANDYFGWSVSISGNNAIVGAPHDDVGANTDQGSVSVYHYNGSAWVLVQKITDATGAADDYFGSSVSISGNYAIVGAPYDNVGANAEQGSASIYLFNGINAWGWMQKITDEKGAANDLFGWSVSISGKYAIVGAYQDEVGANSDQGSVSIFKYNNVVWILMQKITDATGAADDRFGYSVTISGNYVIVGAPFDNVGANADQGSVSIYQYDGTNWILMQKLTDPSGMSGDSFGTSVSISGNYVIVGAGNDYVGANLQQGSASIYVRIGPVWQRVQYVTDPAGNADDRFGFATSIDGNTKRFLVGAYGFNAYMGKTVFGKIY